MIVRLAWVAAAPILAVAAIATTVAMCSVWAAELVIDADPYGDDQ